LERIAAFHVPCRKFVFLRVKRIAVFSHEYPIANVQDQMPGSDSDRSLDKVLDAFLNP
jgi:hypothetical protein